jgi:PAS domain S-box-containing protein
MIILTMLAILISALISIRSSVKKRQVQVIDTLTMHVDQYLEETEHLLHVAGHSIFDIPAKNQSSALAQVRNHFPRYSNLLLLDEDGNVIIEESDIPSLLGLDMTGQPYYKAAIASRDIIFSDPFVSISSRLASVTVTYPVYDNEVLEGMLVGEMNLSLLQNSIEEVEAGNNAESFILDSRGVVIAHPQGNWIQEQRNLADYPLFDWSEDKATYSAHYSDPNSGNWVVGTAKNLSNGWVIVTSQPVMIAYQGIIYTFLVSMIGFGSSLAVFFYYQVKNAKRISTPLTILSERTQNLVSTPYESLEIDQTENFAEITNLTQSFDKMAADLHERDKHLEDQVKIRSAEIIEKSNELENAYASLQIHSQDLALMNEINAALLRGDPIKEVVELFAERTKDMYSSSGASGSAVFLLNKERTELIAENIPVNSEMMRKIENLFESKLPLFRIPLVNDNIHSKILQEGHPRALNDLEDLDSYFSDFINPTWIDNPWLLKQSRKLAAQVRKLIGVKSMAVFPLVAGNDVIGLMEFNYKEDFSLADMERLETIANQLAVAIQRAQVGEEILAEKNFTSDLIDSLPGIFYIFDEEGKFLRWNLNFELLTGFSTEQILKAHPLDFIFTDDHGTIAERIGQVFQHGFASVEGRLVTVNGPISYLFSGRKVTIEGKDYLMGSGIDISDRTEAENSLKQRSLELERSNQDLERFAFIASHDLQEPLRKIQSFGDRLVEKYQDVLDDRGRNYLLRMMESARRNQEMVDDLLIYSRISTSFESSDPVNLNQVLKEVLSNLQNQIEITNATVNTETLPLIWGDRSQITQLFQHLIDNSLKFKSDERDPMIQISADNGRSDQIVITFTDNGIGLDPKYTEKIFQPFQRLHGRDLYPGSGIGLAICRRIMEQHKGKIEVESTPGKGTTILLFFPKE